MMVANEIIVGMPTMPFITPKTTALLKSRAFAVNAATSPGFCTTGSGAAGASAGLATCCRRGCVDMLVRDRVADGPRPSSTSSDKPYV